MNKDPIAFFDSGVGGVTVFEKLKKLLPKENYIYFGDLKNVPYGAKTKEELLNISREIFDFFTSKNVKAVVMACNTTSANVYEEIKNDYDFKIYPIIQSCAGAIAQMPIKKVGIFATEATIKSGAYAKELQKHNPDLQVIEISCPTWVRIVEENLQDEKTSVEQVKFYLDKMTLNKPDKIVLGCTHYPYLINILEQFVPKSMLIDPSEEFAEFIRDDLEANSMLNLGNEGHEEFYVSANPEGFMNTCSFFYPLKELPKLKLD